MDYHHWLARLDDDDPAHAAPDPADRLPPVFAAHRRDGAHRAKHALVPVVHHTHQLHDAVRDAVLPRRAHALALLADASLRFENAARRDMIAARAIYDDAKAGPPSLAPPPDLVSPQRALDALLCALDDLVCQSDRLFDAFKTDMHEHAQRLRLRADQMPVDAARLVSSLQKNARHLGAEDHAKAKENLLRGILEKY